MTGRQAQHLRICVACRNKIDQNLLIRLTVDSRCGSVILNDTGKLAYGRSAYICRAEACIQQALKGTRLKYALEGRKVKGAQNRRTISWPLEPQLIQQISKRWAEAQKTCQNTEGQERS